MQWLALIKLALQSWVELSQDFKLFLGYLQKAEKAGWFEKTANDFRPLLKGPTTIKEKDDAAEVVAHDINKL